MLLSFSLYLCLSFIIVSLLRAYLVADVWFEVSLPVRQVGELDLSTGAPEVGQRTQNNHFAEPRHHVCRLYRGYPTFFYIDRVGTCSSSAHTELYVSHNQLL